MNNILDIIAQKRNNQPLSQEQIEYVIDAYVDGKIADYQMSSLLMAICINGVNQEEINYLTKAFIDSGDVIDLSQINKPTVDKHSTGGVGDKISLLIAPILACFGVDVAKMSGRGLGFTGGTLDKLEAIEGFNINLSEEQFIKQVNEIGISIISQTGNLVPADKKIYALRDVSGTVDSIGLIAASIMSKKIAAGADHICLDVKCGEGAFMKDLASAKELATTLINIGKAYDKKICAVISTMDQVLGYSVGNSIEVLEVIKALQGNGPSDLMQLAYSIIINLLAISGQEVSKEDIDQVINSGAAYNKFVEFITYQGASADALANLKVSDNVYQITAKTSGYVKGYKTQLIGQGAQVLGAGRIQKTDQIDHSVGLVAHAKVGDYINQGDVLFTIYYNEQAKLDNCINYLEKSIILSDQHTSMMPVVLEVLK